MGFVSNIVGSVLGAGGGQNGSYSASGLSNQQNGLAGDVQTNINNVNDVYTQQQNLANVLLNQAQGQGPNVANAMLQQQTNQNAQQAAGLLASQKGIGGAGAAMSAAQQLGNANQQAAQQASVNRMQQQLGAQGNIANLYGQIGQQQLQQQQVNQGAIAAQNNATNAQSGVNAGMAQQNAKDSSGMIGGLLGAAGKALPGIVGGIGSAASGLFSSAAPVISAGAGDAIGAAGSAAPLLAVAYNGGEIDPDIHAMAKVFGYSIGGLAAQGGHVPGQAKVSGDSIKNDVVPAMLSPKEIVLPRSVTLADDAPQKAAEFVSSIKAQKNTGGNEEGEFKAALKREAGKRKK
jgi:hypothetical protein